MFSTTTPLPDLFTVENPFKATLYSDDPENPSAHAIEIVYVANKGSAGAIIFKNDKGQEETIELMRISDFFFGNQPAANVPESMRQTNRMQCCHISMANKKIFHFEMPSPEMRNVFSTMLKTKIHAADEKRAAAKAAKAAATVSIGANHFLAEKKNDDATYNLTAMKADLSKSIDALHGLKLAELKNTLKYQQSNITTDQAPIESASLDLSPEMLALFTQIATATAELNAGMKKLEERIKAMENTPAATGFDSIKALFSVVNEAHERLDNLMKRDASEDTDLEASGDTVNETNADQLDDQINAVLDLFKSANSKGEAILVTSRIKQNFKRSLEEFNNVYTNLKDAISEKSFVFVNRDILSAP